MYFSMRQDTLTFYTAFSQQCHTGGSPLERYDRGNSRKPICPRVFKISWANCRQAMLEVC